MGVVITSQVDEGAAWRKRLRDREVDASITSTSKRLRVNKERKDMSTIAFTDR